MMNSSKKSQEGKEGFILFMVMGVLAVLTLASLIALSSARLESRTARNHYHSVRALYHAEAGVKLVKGEVERRLQLGESLSTILSSLTVTAPQGIDFQTISNYETIVPERLFSFESVGISEEARASVVVQFRRTPVMTMGLFGDLVFDAQNHTTIYGYDSRIVGSPTAADNNGGASIGSNGNVNLGNNNFTLSGTILLGETSGGSVASCTDCDNYTQMHIGHIYYDPLGIFNGGTKAQEFASKVSSNDNTSSNDIVVGTVLDLSNDGEVVLPPGDYYLTDFKIKGSDLIIDNTNGGQVRFYLDGPMKMWPGSDLRLMEDGSPMDMQIYSISDEELRIQPQGDLTAFIYAPIAEVGLQPMGNFFGNVWAGEIDIQPQGDIFVDTSIADSWMQIPWKFTPGMNSRVSELLPKLQKEFVIDVEIPSLSA